MTAQENKLKHLDLLQSVITRMNSNSFMIKGWAVTLIAVIFAFAGKDEKPQFITITLIVLPVFWGLDAYYLSMEKRYRVLYDRVRQKDEADIDFDMTLPGTKGWKNVRSWWIYCLVTKTIWPVYLCIAAMAFIAHYFLFHSWLSLGK